MSVQIIAGDSLSDILTQVLQQAMLHGVPANDVWNQLVAVVATFIAGNIQEEGRAMMIQMLRDNIQDFVDHALNHDIANMEPQGRG